MALQRLAKFSVVLGGGLVLMNYYDVRQLRSVRVGITAASIMLDYKRTLWNLDKNLEQYDIEISKAHTRSAHKLHGLCCRNKGTYIKLGQLLGALDYILPREYTEVLKSFHDDAPRSSLEDIKKVVREDLKLQNVEDVFVDFSPEPIGTASLAQVHIAKLKSSGEKVAVKVQHPYVREESDFDMTVTEWLTRQAAKFFPDFKLIWLAEETRKHLPLELDFLHEGRNAEKVAKLLKDFEWVKHSSNRVLVMEFCEGGQVNDLRYFKENNIDSNHLSRLLGKMYSEMIFVHGFVHCDPHPGNVLVRRRSKDELKKIEGTDSMFGKLRSFLPYFLGGKTRCSEIVLVLLDHGLYEYASLWQGLINSDIEKIKKHSASFGVGDLYPLFATMITVRSWKVVCEKGIKRTKFSEEEDNEIRTGVPDFLTGISKILNMVPRPMVMLFKTNDLLRMLEVLHGTRSDSSGFLSMSKCCLKTVSKYEGKNDKGLVQELKRSTFLQFNLLKIVLYEWFLWFKSSFSVY